MPIEMWAKRPSRVTLDELVESEDRLNDWFADIDKAVRYVREKKPRVVETVLGRQRAQRSVRELTGQPMVLEPLLHSRSRRPKRDLGYGHPNFSDYLRILPR
jgi:hypothetical protein